VSIGGDGLDHQEHYIDKLYAEGEAGRLAKEAKAAIGHRSLWRRLRERVRPPRQAPDAGGQARTR
jgi:hypothetical protein